MPAKAGIRTVRLRFLPTLLLAALLVPTGGWAQACPDAATLTAGMQAPLSHVRYLSDDALGGREVASAGERCAAD
jgi:hypothetical protein